MNELVPAIENANVPAVVDRRNDMIKIIDQKIDERNSLVRMGNTLVRIPRREIVIDRQRRMTDPNELMTMIKQITQMIGDYKKENTLFSDFMISGLRKIRSSMVATLQEHFHIGWTIDRDSGESIFSMY